MQFFQVYNEYSAKSHHGWKPISESEFIHRDYTAQFACQLPEDSGIILMNAICNRRGCDNQMISQSSIHMKNYRVVMVNEIFCKIELKDASVINDTTPSVSSSDQSNSSGIEI